MTNVFLDQPVEAKLPDGSELPVWRNSAASQMKIDVVVNAEGNVLVLHEKAFPDYLEWIEFDAANGEMTFITAEGKLQDLGMIIHPPMNKFVARAKQICTVCLRDGEIRDLGILPLLVRGELK